jgi:hypothetical protein
LRFIGLATFAGLEPFRLVLMDSFVVFRCGKKVYERTYPHDYVKT